jgi:hypothetical protein
MPNSHVCAIKECRNGAYLRGWCHAHYRRWLRHGSPLGGRTANGAANRYLSQIVLSYQGAECLIWPYARNPVSGQAVIRINNKTRITSRVVLEETQGPPPTPRHEAAHSCGKGHLGCVNPAHLVWKTHIENLADRVAHGTINRGARNWSTKLTENDVRQIRLLLEKGESERQVGRRFGVSDGAINAIRRGRSWAWLT